MPRISIKGQVLTDLVAEFAKPPIEIVAEKRNIDGKPIGAISMPRPPCWKVYVDGAANRSRSRVGLVLVSPEKTIIEKSLRLGFSAMNNETKHKALLQGMAMVHKCEDARVLKPGQTLAVRLLSFQLVTYLQKWKHPCRFIGHACYHLGREFASNYSCRASG